MKIFKSKKGFTMVELIIVISVLAVLAAIAVPVAGNILGGANTSSDASNVELYQSAIEKFVASPNTAVGVGARPNGGAGVYPATAGRAVQAIITFTRIKTATISAPKSAAHFYYNTTTHVVAAKAAAGLGDVQIDNVVAS